MAQSDMLFFTASNATAPPAPGVRQRSLDHIAARMRSTGQWSERQTAGRRWSIGCVSLEITQRCNLDCTLCYLSESAEAIRDLPLDEVFRRIDVIAAQYGPNTDVQISGGDPTLRDKRELSEIVRYIRAQGLRASLFTNGILLTRDWLQKLVSDGLNDVAFHVDVTQQRKGFATELELNKVREQYINMARGIDLSVIFNTTIAEENFHELPMLADFFVRHNDVVHFASFQLGATTGRGTAPGRDPVALTQRAACEAIERGAGIALNFDALHGGHHACNRYAMLFTIGGQRFDALADAEFVARVMRDTADVVIERDQAGRGALVLARAALARPQLWRGFIKHTTVMFWRARHEWFRERRPSVPAVRKISFFVHNFMDACALDAERIDACVFMAATVDGPMSMCAYNADRDRFLLKPIARTDGSVWQPIAAAADRNGEVRLPVKWLKGKSKADMNASRNQKVAA